MPQRFFELADDVYVPQRWHLAMPRDRQGQKVDDWLFTRGAPLHIQERLRIPVEIVGKPLDYTEAGIGIPVVHEYLILVATHCIRCIDEQASRIELWTHEDGVPHMVGQYSSVRDMRIDRSKVGSAKVFRPEGWEVALVISGEIHDALERMGATGTRFAEV